MSLQFSLARSRSILHPSGEQLRTPLLIPSFSSKGFPTAKDGTSEVRKIFEIASQYISDCLLVSAYDIRHKHLPSPSRFKARPRIVFLDSGGYETGANEDLSWVYRFNHKHKAWTEKKFRSVLNEWPDALSAVVVNFDAGTAGKSVKNQIAAAQRLLFGYNQFLRCFLMKPTKSCGGALGKTLQTISGCVNELAAFDIIGVTEKELGSTTLERMACIARLRKTLDEAKPQGAPPIHVFGCLDPISVVLYFLSGAEIFDGLTWLRFGYLNGYCLYTADYGNIRHSLETDPDFKQVKMIADNLGFLQELQIRLKSLPDLGTVEDLVRLWSGNRPGIDRAFFERAMDRLKSELGA